MTGRLLHLVERDPSEISGRVLSGEATVDYGISNDNARVGCGCDCGDLEGRRDDEVTGSEKKGRTRTKVLARVTIRPGQSNQGQIKSSQSA